MLASLITHIGPWTFLYGAAFSGLALGLERLVRWTGAGVLVLSLLVLKDVPGTFFAVSIYLLLRRRDA